MIVVPGSIWKDLGACTWLCISIIIQPYQKKTMHWQIEYRKMSTKITNEYKKIAKSEKKYARDQKWIQNEYITGKGKPILEKVSQIVFIHWFNRLLW